MRKKFISSEIFRKKWFRKLPLKYKLFWIYLLAECNAVGVIDFDIEQAEFYLGTKIDMQEIQIYFREKIIPLTDGKWLVREYLEFQYGKTYETLGDSLIDRNLKKMLEKYKDELTNPTLWNITETKADKKAEHKAKAEIESMCLQYPNLQGKEFQEKWREWVKFRKEIKKSLTVSTAERQLKKLSEWGEEKATASIEQSIENGWRGLFEPKREAKKQKLTDVIKETQ